MKTKEEMKKRIDWLQRIIDQKEKAVREWRFVAQRQNICDNMGVNPISKLNYEIKIAQELIDMCEDTII